MRPLDRIGSLKLKLGALIVATVVGTLFAICPRQAGWAALSRPAWCSPWRSGLGSVQILARGMTSPLREMARGRPGDGAGRLPSRVTATSHDEVGDLARAFNAMAADLDGRRPRRGASWSPTSRTSCARR